MSPAAIKRGQRLLRLRENSGMAIQDVAVRCAVSATYVGLIEKGRRDPGRKLLFKLAALFRVSTEFIETGELAPDDHARVARHALWPEIIYILANHVVVPRLLDTDGTGSESECVRRAVDRAFDAPNFCEYRAWADSSEGRGIARGFEGKWAVEELIERAAGKGAINSPSPWIRLAAGLDVNRSLSRKHYSAVDHHAAPQHPADCFAFDIETTRRLYRELPFLRGHPGDYERDAFREPFVRTAFPPIFWSAAKRWSDRRLAGWLWYLGMPLDLFGPLARLARQYDSPTGFASNAGRFLDQAGVEDRDIFLGLFCDILGACGRYSDRYGTVQCIGGVMRAMPVYPAFSKVLCRREARRGGLAHDLVDLITTLGEDEKLRRCEQALRRIAPPFIAPPMGLVTIDRQGKRIPKPAREKDRPPETLP